MLKGVVCSLVLWFSVSARADDTVECERSQEACDAAILAQCPAGADVSTEEVVSAPGASVVRYRIGFRCRAESPPPPAAPSDVAVVPPPSEVGPALALPAARSEFDQRYLALEVERSRTSFVGPIVMTAVGAGTSIWLLGVALEAQSEARHDGDDANDEIAIVAGVMSAVALGVGVGGVIWLAKRAKKRRRVQREMEEIETQRRTLAYGIDPVSRQLWVGGHF